MQSGLSNTKNSGAAFLWDESFLWGLMAFKALKNAKLPFDLIRSADIKNGALDHYRMLFVPGGWASNKSRTLGDSGIKAIKSFVKSGGNYLGFCGGAGFATQAKGGIGLLDVQRKPTGERVPSFSGRIEINLNEHPIWEGIIRQSGVRGQGSENENSKNLFPVTRHPSTVFYAWWPSQFVVDENVKIQVLATYGDAMRDSFSSDLNVGDVETSGGWEAFEKVYGINLDPARLNGEPAVVEGQYGRGRVVLSLVHFDTPGDENGSRALMNLWKYLSVGTAGGMGHGQTGSKRGAGGLGGSESAAQADELLEVCADLISLGERNFLWFWRNSMLLQWRRGVRGLEYNTLYIMMKEISEILHTRNDGDISLCASSLESMKEKLSSFVEHAKTLLLLERFELQKGPITYIQCDDPEIQQLRNGLFGSAKSHGGMFKKVLDEVDRLLYGLLTN